MKFMVFTLLSSCASIASATSYLCVPEAGAAVTNDEHGTITSGAADVSLTKFVVTNESGKWIVKFLGSEVPLFDKCSSKDFCEHSGDGYSGAYWSSNGLFSITWITTLEKRENLVVAKGRCSKI